MIEVNLAHNLFQRISLNDLDKQQGLKNDDIRLYTSTNT